MPGKPDGDIAIRFAQFVLVSSDIGAAMNVDHDGSAASGRRLIDIENLARVLSVSLVAQDRHAVIWPYTQQRLERINRRRNGFADVLLKDRSDLRERFLEIDRKLLDLRPRGHRSGQRRRQHRYDP
jgi:hypothetical protein